VQTRCTKYADKAFTGWQREEADQKLVLWQISSGLSHSSDTGDNFKSFCRSLRRDFKVPDERKLCQARDMMYVRLEEKITKQLVGKTVVMAVDGWSDHQPGHHV
jgi:hypothetical protein